MIVYKVVNKLTGKMYVGKTMLSADRRWRQHCGKSSTCTYLKNAIAKHGKNSFEFEVIDSAISPKELSVKEMFHIQNLNTLVPNGYNLTAGGEGMIGFKHSLDTKLKMAEKKIGLKRPPYSEEAIQKMRNGQIGRVFSEETKLKLSKALKGIKRSEETKKRMSDAAKARHIAKLTKSRQMN